MSTNPVEPKSGLVEDVLGRTWYRTIDGWTTGINCEPHAYQDVDERYGPLKHLTPSKSET